MNKNIVSDPLIFFEPVRRAIDICPIKSIEIDAIIRKLEKEEKLKDNESIKKD